MMDFAEKQNQIERIISEEIAKQTRRMSNLIDLMDDLTDPGVLMSSTVYNLSLLEAKAKHREMYLKANGGCMDKTEEKMWDALYEILNN